MCGWTSWALCHINHPPETLAILFYWSQKYTLTYYSPDFRLKSSFFESLNYRFILRFMIFAWYLAQAFTIFKWFLYICMCIYPSLFLVVAAGRVELKRRVARCCCLMSGGKALSWWGSSVRAISSTGQWESWKCGIEVFWKSHHRGRGLPCLLLQSVCLEAPEPCGISFGDL